MGHHYQYGCTVICNEQDIYPAMRDLVEVHHMSVKGAARYVHEDSGGKVTEERARQVYIRRTKCSIEQSDKPLRKYTKPEAKIQLENVADAIKKGEVADEDIKQVLDTAAEKVKAGEASPRVAAKAATAFKSRTTEKRPPNEKFVKHKSKVEQMINSFNNAINLLDEVIGKGPNNLSIEDRGIIDQDFRFVVPGMLIVFDKIGLDVRSIVKNIEHRFVTGGNENEKNSEDNARKGIGREPGVEN